MNTEESKGFVFHIGYELPSKTQVGMRFANLRLHAWGVFSNVYRGTLVSPGPEQEVAIKKTWPRTSEKNFELLFLSGIGRQPHKNIVQMLFAFSRCTSNPLHPDVKPSVCESYVFSFLPDTMASVLKAGRIDEVDIKLYTWQLFEGLRYLQAHTIVHRDVKPVNLLVDHNKGILKIGDFGNAKIVRRSILSTSYQVTRFYRAPELLLEARDYYWFIDVWSAGCCVGEMMTGTVMFPGDSTKKMLKLIVRCLGVPSKKDHDYMKAKRIITDESPIKKPIGIAGVLGNVSKEWCDFLSEILRYRPRERLHGVKLLNHPFFNQIFTGKCTRFNGQLINMIITPSDFETAMKNDYTAGRQYAAAVLRGDLKFSLDSKPPETTAPSTVSSQPPGNVFQFGFLHCNTLGVKRPYINYRTCASAADIAIDRIKRENLLSGYDFNSTIMFEDCDESLSAGRTVELIRRHNVDVIFGPASNLAAFPAVTISTYYNIPIISWGLVSDTELDNVSRYPTAALISTTSKSLVMAFREVMQEFKWNQFVYGYSLIDEDEKCLPLRNDLHAMVAKYSDMTLSFTYQITDDSEKGLLRALVELSKRGRS
ncbi:unnamed protein product [Caenorhabditis bovis]|uniref:guanylate cyclase n=1 Tax=Caenorhabditis bovis TaxID=2654633 RepID=A0A8S1E6X2_9PELO|nr:unnamed protein product [Caenorhabditis bovis]